MSTKASDAKTYFSDDSYKNYVKTFLITNKEKNMKIDFGKNWRTCHKTSHIINIVGSMIIVLSIALYLNKFQFESKLNHA